MEKRLFQDVSPEERLKLLIANCDKPIAQYSYEKPLSADQLRNVKDVIASSAVDLAKVQNEKKEADREYNDRIKKIKGRIAEKIKDLDTRTTFACEDVFMFIEDDGMVYIYNQDGLLIEGPRMPTSKERSERNLMRAKSESKNNKETANG